MRPVTAKPQLRVSEEPARVVSDTAARSDLRAMRRALALNRAIMDNSLDVICTIDREGRFVEVSAASRSLWGYAPEELVGRKYIELVHPGDVAKTNAAAMAILAGRPTVDFSNRYLGKDGRVVDVDWSAIWSEAEGLHFSIARDATQRRAIEAERACAERTARELNDALARKAEELLQANHELEAFTYSASHDLRAPLRHIDGHARILAEYAGGQLAPLLYAHVGAIRVCAQHMGALIDDLLEFFRLGRKPVCRIDTSMQTLVEQVIRELADSGAARIVRIFGTLPSAHADPGLLRQVWVNLISNALKYSAKRGDRARVEISGERDGDWVRLRVSDNGVGFDMRYADKLFGVFQRLHAQDEFTGTGVGLAIVQRVVSRHGGTVRAEAEVDHGATFTFELPAGAGELP
jgi:PAS domain S-box-containing protein